MTKKILDLQCNILVFIGIFFALRLIHTKDIYIQVGEDTVNTLVPILHTIVLVGLYRVMDKKIFNNEKSRN